MKNIQIHWQYILFLLFSYFDINLAEFLTDNTNSLLNYGYHDPTAFPLGCSPEFTKTKKGLSMELYRYDYLPPGSYPCWDSAYLNPSYPRTGYKAKKLIATVYGVSGDINFKFNPKFGCKAIPDYLPSNFNYHEPITITNFTMILYGYFMPKTTAFHTFYVTADDLLFMNFGAGNAFDCCRREVTAEKFGNYAAYSVWGKKSLKNELTVYLHTGVYYPIRLSTIIEIILLN